MARLAIVAAAGLQALGMKHFDRGVIGRAKGDVGAGVGLALVQMQPERGLAFRPKTRAVVVARAQHITERRQRRGIETHAGVEISNAQSDVVVHDSLQCEARR